MEKEKIKTLEELTKMGFQELKLHGVRRMGKKFNDYAVVYIESDKDNFVREYSGDYRDVRSWFGE